MWDKNIIMLLRPKNIVLSVLRPIFSWVELVEVKKGWNFLFSKNLLFSNYLKNYTKPTNTCIEIKKDAPWNCVEVYISP